MFSMYCICTFVLAVGGASDVWAGEVWTGVGRGEERGERDEWAGMGDLGGVPPLLGDRLPI